MNDYKIALYGAGWIGRTALHKFLKLNIPVWRVLDNNKALWGTKFMGVEISSPSILHEVENCKVIVSTDEEKYKVIRVELLGLGMRENVDFFLYYNKFSTLLMAKMKDVNQRGNLMLASGFSGNQVYIDHQQHKVYRVIQEKDRDWMLNIYNICQQNDFFTDVLINTWLSDSKEFGGKLVFEHEYIPVEISPAEWSPLLIKEAALFVVKLIRRCAKAGLSPIDIHQGNIMYYRGSFVFSDFDGLEENTISVALIERFFNWYINRLLFAAHNPLNIYESSVPQKSYADVAGYLTDEEKQDYKKLKGNCIRYVEDNNVEECCDILNRYIESLDLYSENIWFLPEFAQRAATGYGALKTEKEQCLTTLLDKLKPASILEFVCGNEIYGLDKADRVDRVVIAGLYHEITDYVFKCIKTNSLDNIYPVRMDMAAPTLGVFRDAFVGDGPIPARSSRNAIMRYKSECVLALGCVDHYTLNCGLDFEELLGQLALYTTKWLIIDFDDNNDIVKSIVPLSGAEWYRRDIFEQSLERFFNEIKPLNKGGIYLCKL